MLATTTLEKTCCESHPCVCVSVCVCACVHFLAVACLSSRVLPWAQHGSPAFVEPVGSAVAILAPPRTPEHQLELRLRHTAEKLGLESVVESTFGSGRDWTTWSGIGSNTHYQSYNAWADVKSACALWKKTVQSDLNVLVTAWDDSSRPPPLDLSPTSQTAFSLRVANEVHAVPADCGSREVGGHQVQSIKNR